MSGYQYGNPAGGYPPQYGGSNNNFQPPPAVPNYNDNQSCASLYGTQGSYGGNQMPDQSYGMGGGNQYPPPAPYDSFGGNQMPNQSYGMGGGGNQYPPPQQPYGGQMPPALQQPYGGQMPPAPHQPYGGQMPPGPQQQYGGFGGSQYPAPYPQQPPPSSSGMYPNIQGPSSYGGGPPGPVSYPQQPAFHPQEQQSILLASLEQYQGTVFPSPTFNPDADCQALAHAMKGAGTNERSLIEIITNRSNIQRQQIKLQYKTMFGVDLVKQVGGELSGHFKETMTALFDAPANYEAWSLHEAMSSGREGTLREILLTRTNAEIRAIAETYRRLYNKDLEHDITSRVRGNDFKRMLVSAVQGNREELNPQQIQQARQAGIESIIDRNRARQDADDLYKAGEGKWGTDEKTFNAIFARRSYYQLRATFEEYQRKYHKDMAQVIRSEFSGDAKEAYLSLIACIRDRPAFFAERLHKAISGIGTKDSTLIRVIVSRSEIDLAQVKQRYQQMYNRSLARDVAGDTSGDYERILLAIVK